MKTHWMLSALLVAGCAHSGVDVDSGTSTSQLSTTDQKGSVIAHLVFRAKQHLVCTFECDFELFGVHA